MLVEIVAPIGSQCGIQDFTRHVDVGNCLKLEKRVSVKPVTELVHRDVRAMMIRFVPNSECRPGRPGRSDVIG